MSDQEALTFRCSRCKATKPGADFHPSQQKNGAWCRQCMAEWHRGRAGPAPDARPCEWCGQVIDRPDKHGQKYCSPNCKQRALYWRRNPREERSCPQCGTDLTDRRRGTVYCSTLCAGRGRAKRTTPEQRRRARLKSTYGVEADFYDQQVAQQDGKCAICDTRDPATHHGFWVVDHCHKTGKVRALLCSPCNVGLGLFADDPARLRTAAEYLDRHQQDP